MKRIHGKLLIALAIPVMVAAVPSVTFATCVGGIPQSTNWDPSVRVPRTAKIGAGTDIGPNVSIAGYVRIGTCGQIGLDGQGVTLGRRANLGDGVVITGNSRFGSNSNHIYIFART